MLVRTLPPDTLDDRLRDIIAWLGFMVRTTDSSLVDAWESAGELPEAGDGDFRIEADVDLDATQEEGEVIFKNYRVGFVEDLAE